MNQTRNSFDADLTPHPAVSFEYENKDKTKETEEALRQQAEKQKLIHEKIQQRKEGAGKKPEPRSS